MAEGKEELKSPLMGVKEESKKADLKLNIQITKIMVSGPITSWHIEIMEIVTDFILLGSKITADGDCSHETKKLAPCKESYDKPRQHIKKQRHHFADRGPYSQSYGFSSSQYGCENWTMKEAEYRQINAFKLWFWRRLKSPLDFKEINPVNRKGNQS